MVDPQPKARRWLITTSVLGAVAVLAVACMAPDAQAPDSAVRSVLATEVPAPPPPPPAPPAPDAQPIIIDALKPGLPPPPPPQRREGVEIAEKIQRAKTAAPAGVQLDLLPTTRDGTQEKLPFKTPQLNPTRRN